jgi:hypothetical protein
VLQGIPLLPTPTLQLVEALHRELQDYDALNDDVMSCVCDVDCVLRDVSFCED